MARLARVVIPGLPHHVTQRGNRRLETFFGDQDYGFYLSLLAAWSAAADCEVWAYCLMPNHVHLILMPGDEDGLRRALGETHRRYSRQVNLRQGWRGHLWQERFHSFPMDEAHLLACARYVELNPVRAGLVRRARAWPWSSARAHLAGADDGVVRVAPLLERVADWQGFLRQGVDEEDLATIRRHASTGRPLGSASWLEDLEARLGRRLRPGKPGRPRKAGPIAEK
jgi:putative transposase